MTRYGWTGGLFGARRLDGLEVNPPLAGCPPSFWLTIPGVPGMGGQVSIDALDLDAACEWVDNFLPLPEWWRQFVPEGSEA